MNVLPNAEELSQIATTSADTAAAFGIEPRVAVLSYSTFGSGSGPEVDKVSQCYLWPVSRHSNAFCNPGWRTACLTHIEGGLPFTYCISTGWSAKECRFCCLLGQVFEALPEAECSPVMRYSI